MVRRALLAALVAAVGLALPAAAGQVAPVAGAGPDQAARARLLELADARRWDGAALAGLAADGDAGVRAAVARTLGELAREEAAGILAALAGDCSATVRAAAMQGAGRLAATPGLGAEAQARLAALVERGLGDADAPVRRAAAWAAGELAGAGDRLLERLAGEGDGTVRAAILAELWRVRPDGWREAAAAALGAAEPAERLAAAVSLGRGGGKDDAAALLAHLADADPPVRTAVLQAGRRLDAAAFAPAFAAALGDADARVRTAALEGLAAAGRGARAALSPAAERRLAAMIGDGAFTDAQERVAAIRAAGALGCCADALAPLAAGQEPWASGAALVALARAGDGRAVELATARLASGDAAVRADAVRATRWLSSPSPFLARALADADPLVRLAAIEASAALALGERAALLRPLLGDADAAVRAAAVEGLGEAQALPPPATLLALLRGEEGRAVPDAAVALVAALAGGETLSGEVREALEGLAAGPDPVAARAAWGALRRHGSRLPLPEVATGETADFYRQVAAWAERPRWLAVRTWRGTMQVALDTGAAPLTAYRLSRLADEKFFDGLTFHRVVPDFVAQGGDPRGDGWGGPGFTLRDELCLAPFDPGAVGLALAGPDTGGSQLFVTLTPQPHLLGRYPTVGRVVRGLDVARRLRVGDRILRVRAGDGAPPEYFPVFYGVLDPGRLDAEIAGWRRERERYQPRQADLDLLATAKLRYDVTVAMGTWCSDSHEQVPRLEKVVAALGARSPFARVTLIGVDRSKAAPASEWPFGPVELVPTIVVSAGGAEIGRIVETPSSGSIEQDLVRILAPVEGFTVENESGR